MHGASRTILVTGATGGIGRAVCERLSNCGASLLLATRDAARLQSLCAALPRQGSARHTWISVDMTLDESVRQFEGELTARGVILDAVVLMPPQDPPTSDPLPTNERWRETLQGSFVGPLARLKAAIGMMQPDPASGERSRIVIISGI
jgi:3-oxoacyl-[acyl-carrier protein] reductase